MDPQTRAYLREEVDKLSRERVERGYLDCDPESLTKRAIECDELGYIEMGDALRKFRDDIVNPLLGEGWTQERLELAVFNRIQNNNGRL